MKDQDVEEAHGKNDDYEEEEEEEEDDDGDDAILPACIVFFLIVNRNQFRSFKLDVKVSVIAFSYSRNIFEM